MSGPRVEILVKRIRALIKRNLTTGLSLYYSSFHDFIEMKLSHHRAGQNANIVILLCCLLGNI